MIYIYYYYYLFSINVFIFICTYITAHSTPVSHRTVTTPYVPVNIKLEQLSASVSGFFFFFSLDFIIHRQ